jgi:glycosyltransferase involved in cell wall biosynthesis
MRVLYKRTKAVVTVSKGVAEDLKSLGLNSKNFKVIYNPMDIADIKKKAKEDPKHEWLENKSQPILLGVGRLTYQKDFAMLIKAFSKICKNTDARLIILGEGEERKNLQKLVNKLGLQDHVDMPGFVDNPYAYMSKAEVFVLSSRYEGFGNVLVEAMACGTPVVSTNCPVGPSEILDKGKYGKLVPVGDVEAMEKAIIETLHNLKLSADELQKRASHFSVERATDRYLQLID